MLQSSDQTLLWTRFLKATATSCRCRSVGRPCGWQRITQEEKGGRSSQVTSHSRNNNNFPRELTMDCKHGWTSPRMDPLAEELSKRPWLQPHWPLCDFQILCWELLERPPWAGGTRRKPCAPRQTGQWTRSGFSAKEAQYEPFRVQAEARRTSILTRPFFTEHLQVPGSGQGSQEPGTWEKGIPTRAESDMAA